MEPTTRTQQDVLNLADLPAAFEDVAHLETVMSTPTVETVSDLAKLSGPIMLLGVAGKMGITLARLIKRAHPDRRVIGVARFSSPGSKEHLESFGVETIVCDLLDREAVQKLPQVPNVIYMAGLKFDATGREDFLWAMNVLAPSIVAESFPQSRIVVLSSIHVYPWSNPLHGGVTEQVPPLARPGEYANSVVGRERVFQYYSRVNETPGVIARFVYAIDPRYGVLQEIASWVLNKETIPLETGTVNIMWQGDAINQFARLLLHCDTPMQPLNIGGPEAVSVRHVAERFGEIFDVEPQFSGDETTCLYVNCDRGAELLGNPNIAVNQMIDWVADWVKNEKPIHGLPSKFQVRSGIF